MPTGRCPPPACTACPSSGRTSGRCTSGPGSSTRSGPGPSTTATPEIVLLARVDELPRPTEPPIGGLRLGRALGVNGTRLYGSLDDKPVGYIEVDANLTEGGRLAHLGGWADVGNLHVEEPYRRRGVATWLFGQAADWLRLARVERLLD